MFKATDSTYRHNRKLVSNLLFECLCVTCKKYFTNGNEIIRYVFHILKYTYSYVSVPEIFSVFILFGQLLYKAILYKSNSTTYFSLRIKECLFSRKRIKNALCIDVNILFQICNDIFYRVSHALSNIKFRETARNVYYICIKCMCHITCN